MWLIRPHSAFRNLSLTKALRNANGLALCMTGASEDESGSDSDDDDEEYEEDSLRSDSEPTASSVKLLSGDRPSLYSPILAKISTFGAEKLVKDIE